jgi:hypothetical protein
MWRLEVLSDLCGNPSAESLEKPKFPGATPRAMVVAESETAHLWLAETFVDEFQYHFDECCFDQVDAKGRDRYEEIEGLVLGSHGKLRTRLTNSLGSHNAYRLTQGHRHPTAQVETIASLTHAMRELAGKRRTDPGLRNLSLLNHLSISHREQVTFLKECLALRRLEIFSQYPTRD